MANGACPAAQPDMEMPVGFRVIVRRDQIEMDARNPSRGVRLVSVAQVEACRAVLFGRLYYRQALLEAMPADAESVGDSDAALALRLYRAQGWQAFARLEGDFALVVWDETRRWLVGVRDPMGGYPLFWTRQPAYVAFGTGLRELVALLPSRTLNLEYVADFLMMPGQRNELSGAQCAYEDIARVAPGTALRIEVDSEQVTEHRYWDWLAHLQRPASAQLSDIAAQYGEQLRQAVRERLHGRVLAHLSGGMDSTAVALLARDEACAGFGVTPLHTLSLIYERLPVLARERPYIEAALQSQAGLIAHRLPADDWLDFVNFANCLPHDEPYAALWRLWMDEVGVNLAVEVGATTMLTGIGADDLLDSPPYHLANLLRRGRWRQAWREAARWAEARCSNAWDFLKPFGIDPLLSGRWVDGGRGFGRRRLNTPLDRQRDWTVPDWIQPAFARRYALRERAAAQTRQLYRQCDDVGLSMALNALAAVAGNVPQWIVAAPQGVMIAHPFLDRRVLSLGLGILAVRQPEPGRLKPVLGAAMPALPACIRERRSKGHFSELYYLGLAKHLPDLEALVRRSSLVERGVLDASRLIAWLREGGWGGANVRQLQRINYALALMQWLALEEARGMPGRSEQGWETIPTNNIDDPTH